MGKTKSRGNGEGSIFQRTIRNKKMWVAEYTLGIDENGKRKSKTIYGKTRQEVKDKLELLITQLKTDKYVSKSNINMYQLGKIYIEELYNLNRIGDSTYIRKLGTLKQLDAHYISHKEIQKITSGDIKDFLKYLTNFSNSSIDKIYGLSNTIFKLAIKRNIIKYNFFEDKFEYSKPKSTKLTKKVTGFTVQDQRKFIEILNNPQNKILYRTQFLLSLYTGMRMR